MDEEEIPALTVPDLSWRVRFLQAEVEALRGLCLALAATHQSPDALGKAWGLLKTQMEVQSLELEAMSQPPQPEETSWLRERLHELQVCWTQLRRLLATR